MRFRSSDSDGDTIGKLTRVENTLFTLSIFACLFLAPGAAAILLFGNFLWWARLLWRRQRTGTFDDPSTWPLLLGMGIGFLVTALGALTGILLQGASWGVWNEALRMAAKLFLWGVVSLAAIGGAYRRGFTLARHGKWIVLLAAVTLGYLVVQRYTGVDWVGGFSKRLPANRFAYGVYRPNGWVGHPLTLGFNLMLITVVAWIRGFHPGAVGGEQKFWRSLFGIAGVSLVLNQSRWPIGVTLAIIALTGLVFFKKHWKMVVLILGLAGAALFLEPGIRGRVAELATNPQQFVEKGERFGFWKIHARMFADHPVLGVGYHRRKSAALDYYKRAGYTESEKKYAAHNIYLQILADSGIVGFLGFTILILGVLVTGWRRLQKGYPALLALLAAAMLGGTMQNNFRDSEFLFCFWMLVAVCLAQGNDLPRHDGDSA